MAQWSRKKVNSQELNDNNEYTKDSDFSLDSLNAVVNSGLYSQDFVEHLADTPDVSEAGNVGTPTVTFVANPNATTDKPYKSFKFSNLKGDKGDKGEQGIQGIQGAKGDKGDKGDTGATGATGSPAGFGTPTATATTLTAGSRATVSVSASGADTAKVFNFDFGIPKGADASGAVTINGVEASVDFTSDPQTQINSKADQSALNSTNSKVSTNTGNIANLTTLTNNKADKDLSNVTYPQAVADGNYYSGATDRVILTYISSDGNTWFREWKSGWKECGGRYSFASSRSHTVDSLTLPVQFTTANFNIQITAQSTSLNGAAISAKVVSPNSIGVLIYGHSSDDRFTGFYWKCEGY